LAEENGIAAPSNSSTAAWTARTRNGRPARSRTFVTASRTEPWRRRRARPGVRGAGQQVAQPHEPWKLDLESRVQECSA